MSPSDGISAATVSTSPKASKPNVEGPGGAAARPTSPATLPYLGGEVRRRKPRISATLPSLSDLSYRFRENRCEPRRIGPRCRVDRTYPPVRDCRHVGWKAIRSTVISVRLSPALTQYRCHIKVQAGLHEKSISRYIHQSIEMLTFA